MRHDDRRLPPLRRCLLVVRCHAEHVVNVTVGEHRVPDRTSPSAVWNAITLAKPGTSATPSATGAATPIGAPSANSPRIVASPRHIRSAYSVNVSTTYHGKPGEDRLGTSRLLRPAVPDDGDRMLSRTSSDGLPRR